MKKTNNTKRMSYVEPIDYFPKSVRKANKIGEFSEENKNNKSVKKVEKKK